MDGWRRPPVAGADKPKLEPSPIKDKLDTETQCVKEVDDRVGQIPLSVKKEDLTDVPCKVPKFQYVDFPSLHQCIQQLAIPPLENWLSGCPAGRPSSMASRGPTESVPKFKYVDYPSLHHCIQQLSVPPLESWSSGLARTEGSSGIRLGTGSLASPTAVSEEQPGEQDSLASTQKRYTDTAVPGPSPRRVQNKTDLDTTSHKPQHSLCLSGQSKDRPPISSEKGQAHLKTVSKDQESFKKTFGTKSRPDFLASDSTTTQLKGNKRRPHVNSLYLEMESDQMQLRDRPELKDPADSEQGLWRTITESVCPFCQKMFTNPEELRVHQKSHRDKKPH